MLAVAAVAVSDVVDVLMLGWFGVVEGVGELQHEVETRRDCSGVLAVAEVAFDAAYVAVAGVIEVVDVE